MTRNTEIFLYEIASRVWNQAHRLVVDIVRTEVRALTGHQIQNKVVNLTGEFTYYLRKEIYFDD